MMLRRLLAASALIATLLPLSVSALDGIGPRVTVSGIVEAVRISDKQVSDEYGGEYDVRSSNGQLVTVVLMKETEIVSEGRMSRRSLLPVNITEGMNVRIRGWRVGGNSITASLAIILNVSLNPVLSANGVIQAIGGGAVTVLGQDGITRTFSITNETEVNISYTLYGPDGINLAGKQALLTLNPLDGTQVRILRITGSPTNITGGRLR